MAALRPFLVLLLLHLGHCATASPKVLPTRPQCHRCDQALLCSCSFQHLHSVPTVSTKAVLQLDLSFNELQVIVEDDLREYGSLKTLRVNNNKINAIHERAFSALANLELLDLSFNRLARLSASWFQKLLSLHHLSLHWNGYATLDQGCLFKPLKRLKTLQFGGPALRNVTVDDFACLSGLEELVFHGSALDAYEKGSLEKVGPLRKATISLNGPFQRDLVLVENVLLDVLHPITTLIVTDTKFHTVEKMRPFWVVKKRDVKNLYIRNASIVDIVLSALLDKLAYSMLSQFTVEDSKFFLKGPWGGQYVQSLPHLESAVLKNVDIPQFYNFPTLFFLKPILKVLRKLSVINSKVHTIPCGTSEDLSRLEHLDLSGNLFHDRTMAEMMCDGRGVAQGLRTINLSRNDLQSLNSQLFTKLDNLTTIDLSGNVFHSIPQTCDWPPSLRLLNLSSSHLTKATRCLPQSLHVLDLSDNDLTVFDIELPLLAELYISGNKILSLMDGKLYPSLEVLFIHNNALHTFNNKDLEVYSKLRLLEAGANTFICSCDFVAFMQKGNVVALGDRFGTYVCESPDTVRGLLVIDARLSVFECHAVVALSVLCSSILFTFLVSGALCYKFHALWYLRMTWAWLRAKRKRPVLKRGEVCYDAFVSYSNRDSTWVEEHLVPQMEESQPPLRLCLHKRNFLPGKWILDNIMDAIEKSHRTLFILSQHFVQSEWCKYELDYSHFRLFDENNDTVVLVLLEPIAKETIPKRFCKLRKVMNSRTYLEWPEEEEERPRFWHGLKEAIR